MISRRPRRPDSGLCVAHGRVIVNADTTRARAGTTRMAIDSARATNRIVFGTDAREIIGGFPSGCSQQIPARCGGGLSRLFPRSARACPRRVRGSSNPYHSAQPPALTRAHNQSSVTGDPNLPAVRENRTCRALGTLARANVLAERDEQPVDLDPVAFRQDFLERDHRLLC